MPARMLLAEDSLTVRRVIELTFASEDVTIVSVGDGESAIRQIEMDRPDIVLADVGMPKLDGYALASHLKASPALRDIPVLLLTGAFEPIDEERARHSGCEGILIKPFDPHRLLARVKELIAGPHRATAPPASDPHAGPPAHEDLGHDVPPALENVAYSFGVHTPVLPPLVAQPSSPRAATPLAQRGDPGVPAGHVVKQGTVLTEPAGDGGLELEFDQIEAAFEQRHPHEIPPHFSTDTFLGMGLDPAVWGDRMGRFGGAAHAPDIPLDVSAEAGRVAEAQADQSSPGPAEHAAALVIDEVDDPPALSQSLTHQRAAAEVVGLHENAPASSPLEPFELAEAHAPEVSAPQPAEPVAGAAESRPAVGPAVRTARFTPRVSLASAFSALLAAEQAPPASSTAPAVSEAMVEELVRRVLTRMTEDAVQRLVVDTAERVIRQEIDRIKGDPHS